MVSEPDPDATEVAATFVMTDDTVADTLIARAATVDATQAMPAAPRPVAAASTAAGHDGSTTAPAGVRYVLVGHAGRGGMGTVHVAKDVALLRRVALKEIAPEAASNPDVRARFVREIQVTAQLDHPHVVPVYGLEVTSDDRPAYAMKLVEGGTMADLVARARTATESGGPVDDALALPARLDCLLKVCEAVGYAHARGVIHRDLKPANVMLGGHGEVYVMDWGLCRVLAQPDRVADAGTAAEPAAMSDSHASATRVGAVVGTPRYMAPEQARGELVRMGAHSDQCSLGLILQELVTLRPAISGRDVADVIVRAAAGQRDPLVGASGERIPPELAAIVAKATAADPADRYASVEAFAADIRRYLRGDAVAARPDSTWQRWLRAVARHRQTAAMVVLAFAAVCLAAIAGLLWRHERALTAQQAHERALQALATDVAEHGDVLQTRMLLLQAEIVGLARALEEAAEHDEPVAGAVPWLLEDGTPPDGAPVGFRLTTGTAADAEVVARRVRGAAPRLASWLEHADTRLTWDTQARPGVAPGDRAVFSVRVVFDAGFVVATPVTAAVFAALPADALAGCRTATTSTVTMAESSARTTAVTFCTPLRDDAGQSLGLLLVDVAPAPVLSRLVQSWATTTAGGAVLLDEQGVVRAALKGHDSTTPIDRWIALAREHARPAQHDAGFVETDTAGEPAIVVFDRLHPYEWTLAIVVPAAVLAVGAD